MIKNPPASAGDMGSIPESGRALGGGKWQCTPVSLPEKFHGQEEPDRPQSMGSQRVRHG